jgi:dephospho-CoA kinase
MLIGLTGGIGCGKSAAAADFAAEGYAVVDVDRVVREEVLTDPEVQAMAVGRWGGAVLAGGGSSAGELDRAQIAARIFAAEGERRWWESVVHPRVGARWRARVAAAPQLDWVVEVPLLFEAGLEKGFDFVVCVGANPEVQLARVVARGMTQAQAGQRIASQLPLATKLHSAHAVLWNDGTRDFLRQQVRLLAHTLRPRS